MTKTYESVKTPTNTNIKQKHSVEKTGKNKSELIRRDPSSSPIRTKTKPTQLTALVIPVRGDKAVSEQEARLMGMKIISAKNGRFS